MKLTRISYRVGISRAVIIHRPSFASRLNLDPDKVLSLASALY